MNAYQQSIARRSFLGRLGLGTTALAQLLAGDLGSRPAQADEIVDPGSVKGPWRGVVRPLHHAPKVKRVIQLYMAGGASHLETFDYKPVLAKLDGQPTPESYTKGKPIAQLQGKELKCLGPQAKFAKHGSGGVEISEFFPHLAKVADEMSVIRSLKTNEINHDPAHTLMNTGTSIGGRPCMGSWLQYGLGAETENLPGYVVLISTGKGGQMQPIAARQWHSGFLPSRFQGVALRSQGDPVLYLRNPPGVTEKRQRDVVDAAVALNRLRDAVVDDPEISTRISQYEMAYRMQTSTPELMDVSDESQKTLDLYGTKGPDGTFAYNCLLARRLAERGVRMIQLYHRDWDHHGAIRQNMEVTAAEVDQAMAALITDLKQRGMLEETLIVWNGEFGRTPMAQGNGRDHHIQGFSCWMAGGGVKRGYTHGATDELGYAAVEDVVDIHDYHATILHLLGIDHKKLSVKFQGLDLRLTNVHGRVVKQVLS
jgi:hypothetical protein